MAGNPNPSPETRFQPGQSGNPGGIPAKTLALIRQNGERAARINAMLLEGLESTLKNMDQAGRAETLRADVNKAISDAMDRAYGKAAASIDLTSKDGSMTPALNVTSLSDAALQEIMNARAKPE
jgi:hypothetical protein